MVVLKKELAPRQEIISLDPAAKIQAIYFFGGLTALSLQAMLALHCQQQTLSKHFLKWPQKNGDICINTSVQEFQKKKNKTENTAATLFFTGRLAMWRKTPRMCRS